MNSKVVFGFLLALGVLLFFLRIQSIIERERVNEMKRICVEEYEMVYSHHNGYYFWCYKPAENVVVEIEKVQWGNIERPFEIPKINLSLNNSVVLVR